MGRRSLSVTFVLLMRDEWRDPLEVMIMHSRSRREAGLICACPPLDVKVIKMTGDILVIDRRSLCSARQSFTGYSPESWEDVLMYSCGAVCVCVCDTGFY